MKTQRDSIFVVSSDSQEQRRMSAKNLFMIPALAAGSIFLLGCATPFDLHPAADVEMTFSAMVSEPDKIKQLTNRARLTAERKCGTRSFELVNLVSWWGGGVNRMSASVRCASSGAPGVVSEQVRGSPEVGSTPRPDIPLGDASSITVSVSQPDSDGIVTLSIRTDLDTVSLTINEEEEGARTDGRYSVLKFARVGDTKFHVVAKDRFGNSREQTVTVRRALKEVTAFAPPLNPIRVSESKPRDAVAIIIGIEKYRRAPSADFANNDASVFYDYARRALGVKQENIKLLLDDKADAAEVLRSFKSWLPTRVSAGKTDVYVFYSGHGLPSEDGNSLYFMPHEVDRDYLERTAVTQKEVVSAIERLDPRAVTMFIDSCYSGQSRTGETLLAGARPISVAPRQTTAFPSNFTVISASAPDQISSSSPDLKHGIFSYYLMRGMEGEADSNSDGQITIAEMQGYLLKNVGRRAMGMNRTQQPQVVGDQSRVLVGR